METITIDIVYKNGDIDIIETDTIEGLDNTNWANVAKIFDGMCPVLLRVVDIEDRLWLIPTDNIQRILIDKVK